MKTEIEEFNAIYSKYNSDKEAALKPITDEYNKSAKAWLEKHCPYRIGDVLEIQNNKRMKYQRMVIYDFSLTLFGGHPIVNAYGWWLDKDNNPVKWNGSGFAVIGAHSSITMALSDNQTYNELKK